MRFVRQPNHLHERQIERALEAMLRDKLEEAHQYGEGFATMWRVAAECIVDGKMLRPRLFLNALEALAPTQDNDQAIRLAAAIEMLHYSFLLHDDVIDGDLRRRGRPNFIGTLLREHELADRPAATAAQGDGQPAALHWARSNGILMGDLLLSTAHLLFARESMPDPTRVRLLDLLDRTITESVAGEQLDVSLSDGILTADFETALRMSRLKTASYTFDFPLKAAVIIAGASETVEASVGVVASQMGLAFQLQDDLLSTFGQAAAHGKDAFSDLREGKETAIIAYARTTSAWPRIEPRFGDPDLTREDARRLRELLVECGADRYVQIVVDDLLSECATLLASPDTAIPQPLAQFLTGFIDQLRERDS